MLELIGVFIGKLGKPMVCVRQCVEPCQWKGETVSKLDYAPNKAVEVHTLGHFFSVMTTCHDGGTLTELDEKDWQMDLQSMQLSFFRNLKQNWAQAQYDGLKAVEAAVAKKAIDKEAKEAATAAAKEQRKQVAHPPLSL